MPYPSETTKCFQKALVSCSLLVGFFFLALFFATASAESPSDPKREAFEAVDRNAEAIATVGDVLYYFGEPGMQEYESSKYLKQTLEQIGFNVELGGAGLPTNVWAKWGSEKPVIMIAPKWMRFRKARKLPALFHASRWSKALPDIWKGTT